MYLVSPHVNSTVPPLCLVVEDIDNLETMNTTNIQDTAFHRFRIGSFDALIVSDGKMNVPAYPTYAANANPAEVQRALQAQAMPHDQYTLTCNVFYVDTGKHKILVDTGVGSEFGETLGQTVSNLRLAGVEPKEIDAVILTHAHPDHIGGIVGNNNS